MPLTPRLRIGMLTPSSNTVLEPVTTQMLAQLPAVSVHFNRFRVLEIALSEQALRQFATPEIVRAAALLGDAQCEVIGWNGTSSGWLGFDADEELCRAVEAATGARACTSVLALNQILRATGVRRLGLVTPYLPAVQQRIIANYARIGIEIVAEQHMGLQDNYSFAEVEDAAITEAVRAVAASRPEAIVIFCTNLRGAPLVAGLEAECGLPVYDTIQTVVWNALRLGGQTVAAVTGWGSLFQRDLA